MKYVERLSEQCAVVSVVSPDASKNSNREGDEVDMTKFRRLILYCLIGTQSDQGDGQTKFWLEGGPAGDATTLLEGKEKTYLWSEDGSNFQGRIELTAEELQGINSTYTHARAVVRLGSNGKQTNAGIIGIALHPRVGEASKENLASVKEIVT